MLNRYVVTLYEHEGKDYEQAFYCQAEDELHALEQAIDAYPYGTMLEVEECVEE